MEADRVLLGKFLDSQKVLSTVRPSFGTTAIVRFLEGNAESFLSRLRTEFETTAVPGRFFDLPNHFRIGMGVNTEMFGEGLHRIEKALRAA